MSRDGMHSEARIIEMQVDRVQLMAGPIHMHNPGIIPIRGCIYEDEREERVNEKSQEVVDSGIEDLAFEKLRVDSPGPASEGKSGGNWNAARIDA
ncbi:hypothetical protein KM043_002500 [Ampulex compressa]|nr:hypothetical protein KM043_002500 [Ampulex compressa]